ncbi:sensor histidine kinase RegB [Pararhodobacter sp. CCB-MM2]|uniref:sensor histidine kinase RegB n=1 Tax=Pararhodobacter sp. CCB-MM2 TaxID=1786003 RepID=UPI00082F8080|nr:ActS/PrrB/RegB family redox-sensitive histidine kinase [Pararhodobacter sp. CCB-MM2]MCA2011827.1 ActS/PrrB/RegB family redox-sensitive histidine kinase [Cereibacter sphaeroides]
MDSQAQGLMNRDVQGHWVRLETLTRVRWLAATGQVFALLLAHFVLNLHFALALCLAVVGVSAASNLASMTVFPRTRRLSEGETLLTLIFDTTQLALLLFLTGGMNNPFGLLLIAPVTIAATALTLRAVLILGGLAVALASLLAFTFEPLRTASGDILVLPDLFRYGFWIALVIGIAFIGLYSRSVAAEKHRLTEALLATSMALAREQKLTDLGGVVAAAAHELGTPLATIKLVSAELIDALDDPDLAEDARLIREQADRCRAILRSMGQAGKDDLHLRHAPLEAVVDEAASPHAARGKSISFDALPAHHPDATPMPEILRRPEIVHGLRNLIQNAVDFAEAQVWIEADWDARRIVLRVIDDGPGYPPHLLARIGEPYLRQRRAADSRDDSRPEYEGMGLGLFIAKTLLERTGAQVGFRNCTGASLPRRGDSTRCGALAEVQWPRQAIEADPRRALGDNTPLDPSGA